MKKIPIPSKTWDKYASKANYPTTDRTYDIDPLVALPVDDPEQNNRYLVKTKQGRIMVWESTLIELATILQQNEYKDTQVVFYRDEGDRRLHVKQVKEKL